MPIRITWTIDSPTIQKELGGPLTQGFTVYAEVPRATIGKIVEMFEQNLERAVELEKPPIELLEMPPSKVGEVFDELIKVTDDTIRKLLI